MKRQKIKTETIVRQVFLKRKAEIAARLGVPEHKLNKSTWVRIMIRIVNIVMLKAIMLWMFKYREIVWFSIKSKILLRFGLQTKDPSTIKHKHGILKETDPPVPGSD